MAEERLKLKGKPGGLSVSLDTMYNNAISSGRRPGQGGTIAFTTVVENQSAERKVIYCITANKLCNVGSNALLNGIEVLCPNHPNCTANLPRTAIIGDEGRYATIVANAFFDEGLKVSSVTSDGDARVFSSFEKVIGEGVEKQNDIRHLNANIKTAIKKAEFSDEMFPCRTKKAKENKKSRFATMLSIRCQKEFSLARKNLAALTLTDFEMKKQLKKNLEYTPQAIIECLRGSCDMLCKEYSYCCPQKFISKKNKKTKRKGKNLAQSTSMKKLFSNIKVYK